jgi:hypothetical protein
MLTAADHISDDDIESYATNRLPEDRSALVEEHLLICGACCLRVADADDFVAVLRAALQRLKTRAAAF